jgi:glycosyltransferase
MNKGIKAANGSLIAFLNAGDFYSHKEVIEIVVQNMKDDTTDCCYANVEYVAKENPEKTVRVWINCPYEDGLFNRGWHPPHPAFFVKKNILEKFGYFDLRYKIAADYELMLRLLKKNKINSAFIDKVLTKITVGGESNKNVWNILKANIECYKAWKNNGLRINPIIIIRKPVSKISQYWIKR